MAAEKKAFHPVTSTLFILVCGLTSFFVVSTTALKLTPFLQAYLAPQVTE